MARAVATGWTCEKCGTQRIRTVVIDVAPPKGRRSAAGVQSKCPACGHPERVPSMPGERIISIGYDPP